MFTGSRTKVHLAKVGRMGRSVLSLNRRREYQNLMRMLQLGPSDAVLDVGSGDGFWTSRLATHCAQITGLEPDEQMLAVADNVHNGRNLRYVRGFAESLPFPSGTFSKVVSISCLEHFKDPLEGLREMRRVLKPGGRLALSVDSLLVENSASSFRNWHRRRHFVTEYFSVQKLQEMMRTVGIGCEPERTIHLFRSRLARVVRQAFIPHPCLWLPLFPLLYSVVLIADRAANDTHGQIIIVTGTHFPR